MQELVRTIKYEADRVPGFGKEIMQVPGCENLQSCIQCGTCSGMCPLSIYMDYTPRQIIELVRSDFKNEVLKSYTIWLCASCYVCTVECPREVPITDIMYELKQRAIYEGYYPKRFQIPVLANQFFKMVYKHGRVTENFLVTEMLLKSNWKDIFRSWKLGLKLLARGRFPLKTENVEKKEEVRKMLDVVDRVSIDTLAGISHTGNGKKH
ncbi:MAG: 4Fe-4S dicluster domain-containing protein [Verrucomicrobiia bacterium]|jgi:heterodisulfide reductase subunit C